VKLRDIMSSDVATTVPSESAQVAWERMRERGLHHLVAVLDGEVVGVISSNDLGGTHRSTSRRVGRVVGELMTSGVLTASPNATIRDAAKLMLGESIGCLPILERGKLAGIITVSDLLARIAGMPRGKPQSLRPDAKSARAS
jgi:acetoin utilization protein AcuB